MRTQGAHAMVNSATLIQPNAPCDDVGIIAGRRKAFALAKQPHVAVPYYERVKW